MFSRLAGAFLRAVLVGLLVATPSFLVPEAPTGQTQVVVLISFFAAVFTFSEYVSNSPTLVEFREAAPLNRVRFAALFATIFILSLAIWSGSETTVMSKTLLGLGQYVFGVLDGAYSPMGTISVHLQAMVQQTDTTRIETMLGLTALLCVTWLGLFTLCALRYRWKAPRAGFNVWINLPSFHPKLGDDVAEQLRTKATLSIAIALVLPLACPLLLAIGLSYLQGITLASPEPLIWVLAIWAFLPAALLIRGVALNHVAKLVSSERQRIYPTLQRDDLTPVIS